MGDMIDRDAVLATIKQQVELWEKGTLVCGLDDLLGLYLPQAIAALPAVTVWVKPDRNTFDAMCAMRNSINEHVPMPSLESDLLQGPENSVFCATVAEAVINEVTRLRSMTNGARVKRLEWHNFDAWTHWAEGACGTYHVEERNGYWQVELRVGGLVHGVTETGDTTPEDLDAAKAAAQADYAARILAALEPVTQPAPDAAAIREAALREAHDAIADYPRVSPDSTEAQHYDEQIEHCQSIILAALPAVTVGVKPLEWHQTSTEPARWLGHQADVSNPDYVIHLTADSPDVFAWGLDGDGWHGFCDTLETAQTAAQADYEARILAALEPVTQPEPDAHVNETPKTEHDAGNVLTDAALIARLREIQGQAGLFASAAADRIAALVKEKAAAYAQGYGDCEAEISLTDIGKTNEFLNGQIAKCKARIEALIAEVATSNEIGRAFEQDAGEQRERAEKAVAERDAAVELTWRLRSYAVHDNECKVNKPPRFDPTACSCGLSKALAEMQEEKPMTEYERKVAKMKEDFPNGI